MDIPRLDAKSVSVELVNDAIKHVFLALGYTAATSDQLRRFGSSSRVGMFSLLNQPAKGNLCASPLCQVYLNS